MFQIYQNIFYCVTLLGIWICSNVCFYRTFHICHTLDETWRPMPENWLYLLWSHSCFIIRFYIHFHLFHICNHLISYLWRPIKQRRSFEGSSEPGGLMSENLLYLLQFHLLFCHPNPRIRLSVRVRPCPCPCQEKTPTANTLSNG